jgi:homogentisate 1,2-dioxygenase
MPFYVKRGTVPKAQHTVQRGEKGNLHYEEHISREGFSDIHASVYHTYPPTEVRKVGEFKPAPIEVAEDKPHRHHHFKSHKFEPKGDFVSGRRPIVFNSDVVMHTACPTESTDYFYRNGNADEVIYVHRGSGRFESMQGDMDFGEGDYIVVPRGVTFNLEIDKGETRLFIVESTGPVTVPPRYRNAHGQIEDWAPYSERDIRVPEWREPTDKRGDFPLLLKLSGGFQHLSLAHHPYDVVGWDGYFYPWIFNINDYMPKVGKVHLPPPTHLTFISPGFVLCSFCPRPFDFHENAVPIPYAHSNVDSDEIIYYCDGDFMSRKGIEIGSITFHPQGIPHGPQPGLTEKSLGAKYTNELAVMVDTFRPLKTAKAALDIDDDKYPYSWLEE